MIRVQPVSTKQVIMFPGLGPDDWKIQGEFIIISQKDPATQQRVNIAAFSAAQLEWLMFNPDPEEGKIVPAGKFPLGLAPS